MAHFTRKRFQSNRLTLTATYSISALVWIAQNRGFFFDEDINIDIKHVPYGRRSLELLLDKQTDVGVLIEANVSYMGLMKNKEPIKCFATIQRRTDDGIVILNPNNEELNAGFIRGKTFGYQPRTSSHIFLGRTLEQYNLRLSDVKLVEMTPQVMEKAIVRGDVDGISIWQPHVYNAQCALNDYGSAYHTIRNSGYYASEIVLACYKTTLVKQRKQIQALVRALLKSKEFLDNNPEEAKKILSEHMRMPMELFDMEWERFNPICETVSKDFVTKVKEHAQWVIDNDDRFRQSSLPDYDDLVEENFFVDK